MREARLVKLPRVPCFVLFSINPSPRLPPIESNSKRRKIYASRYIYILHSPSSIKTEITFHLHRIMKMYVDICQRNTARE